MKKNKKSDLLAMIMAFVLAPHVYAQTTPTEYSKNGIAYVLFEQRSSDNNSNILSDIYGVWRFNDKTGTPLITLSESPWKVFDPRPDAKGLSASQEANTSVFLMEPTAGSSLTPTTLQPGTFPNVPLSDNCPFWITVATPAEMNVKNNTSDPEWSTSGTYRKALRAHGLTSGEITNQPNNWTYWSEYPGSYNGVTYNYICYFGGPDGVRHFNATSGNGGTPIWDGSLSNVRAHPDFNNPGTFGYRKVILPSHFGAIGRYLYTTTFAQASIGLSAGQPMDGNNGYAAWDYTMANGYGTAWVGMDDGNRRYSDTYRSTWTLPPNLSPSSSGYEFFGCVIRMIYKGLEKDLNLMRGYDKTNNSSWPTGRTKNETMDILATSLLHLTDYSGDFYYGKWCGDDCIPGNGLNGQPSDGTFSDIRVVTSTKGNAYGFNPDGIPNGTGINAMLRGVNVGGGGIEGDINVDFGTFHNGVYLQSTASGLGLTVANLKSIGVSSDFSNVGGLDHLYGSFAPHFVVQDNWWGLGGIAYEVTDSGDVTKFDYVNVGNTGEPKSIRGPVNIGPGIDDIAVDGDAYLYVLKTEGVPPSDLCKTPNLNDYNYNQSTNTTFNVHGETVNGSVSNWWMPTTGGRIYVAEGNQVAGCYKEIKFQQKVNKVIYRYRESDSGIEQNPELWGKKTFGYDYWKGQLTWDGSKAVMDTTFSYAPEEKKASTLETELAVCNVADSPKSYQGIEPLQVIVCGDPMKSGEAVAEGSELTFKIEGYKPTMDLSDPIGSQRYFRSLGNITVDSAPGGMLNDLRINNCYNNANIDDNYRMAHDENGDNVYSGLPSTMFEASGYSTSVTWYISQVEDNSPSSTNLDNTIKDCLETTSGGVTTLGQTVTATTYTDLCSKTFKFEQPGRYLVKAKISYYIFNNYGSAVRPSDLTISGPIVKETEPFIVKVFANDLKLNSSPSFITNVKLTRNNRKAEHGISGDSGSGFDTGEGKQMSNKFGDITVEFDATFFGLKNYDNSGNFDTFDGIGVWDYTFYKQIYDNLSSSANASGVQSITLSDSCFSGDNKKHVYNFVADFDSSTGINDFVYNNHHNPGYFRAFSDPNKTYLSGTLATGTPAERDFKYIQWFLYLRPFDADILAGKPAPQRMLNDVDEKRGWLIASGTVPYDSSIWYDTGNCKYKGGFAPIDDSDRGLAAPGDLNNSRKYHVNFTIKDIDSKINVPRDPRGYLIDFELVYPRVYWVHDEEINPVTGTKKYYSNIVPYSSKTVSNLSQDCAPVHILCGDGFVPVSHAKNIFNVSTDADSNVFNTQASFTLCIRDKVDPVANNITLKTIDAEFPVYDYNSSTKHTIFESTGEGSFGNASFSYGVYDNNPFLRFAREHEPTNIIATTTALGGYKLYWEDLNDTSGVSFNFINAEKNINESDTTASVTITQTFCDSFFFTKDYTASDDTNKDGYKINIDYTQQITSAFDSGLTAEAYNLSKVNTSSGFPWIIEKKSDWVGELQCSASGTVYDGYGYDGLDTEHPLSIASQSYLAKYDNDPPSIGVQLISQSDNVIWDIQLIEGVKDDVAFASQASNLGKCMLIATQTFIDSGTNGVTKSNPNVPGSTNMWRKTSSADPEVDDNTPVGVSHIVSAADYKTYLTSDAIPKFRKGSHLLINVDIFDNCGYYQLNNASIKVTNNGAGGSEVLLNQDVTVEPSHDEYGKVYDGTTDPSKNFVDKPRGTFAVDLPFAKNGDEQISIEIFAEDYAGNKGGSVTSNIKGNKRMLIIPVTLVDTSFDARVIQHSEQKR